MPLEFFLLTSFRRGIRNETNHHPIPPLLESVNKIDNYNKPYLWYLNYPSDFSVWLEGISRRDLLFLDLIDGF
jgi:hypothetical protein